MSFSHPLRTVILGALLVALVGLWGCEEEKVQPRTGDGTQELANLSRDKAPAFPMPDLICSDVQSFPLIDNGQRLNIANCGSRPCKNPNEFWGGVDLLNSPTDLYLNISLAEDWLLEKAALFAGLDADLTYSDTLPQPDSLWLELPLESAQNRTQLLLPLDSLSACFELAAHLRVVKLLKDGRKDPKSRQSLWLFNQEWNDSASVLQTPSPGLARYCQGFCPPNEVELTGGDCVGCEAAIDVRFVDCDTVFVKSCKELVGVELVFEDCERMSFEELEGVKGKYYGSGAHSGKEIAHVFVKSGCYESPGGNDWGRRFDGPCANGKCGFEAEEPEGEMETGKE